MFNFIRKMFHRHDWRDVSINIVSANGRRKQHCSGCKGKRWVEK
jgi:hypothetical protein